jgi:hypothetical protein
MTTFYGALDNALEDLVYRHADPADRIRQTRAISAALTDIILERIRQETIGEAKRARGIPWRSCADPEMDGGDMTRVAVLGEEFGEVANAALERTYGSNLSDRHLRDELVQVAAVSLAWIEAIDERAELEDGTVPR